MRNEHKLDTDESDLEYPLLLGQDDDDSDLITRTEEPNTSWVSLAATLAHFVLGFLIGSGTIFLTTQVYIALGILINPNSLSQVVTFSCLWSFGTYFVAYLLFGAVHNSSDETRKEEAIEKWEQTYAMGVFCGFCLSCLADLQYTMSTTAVLWAVGLSMAWVLLLVVTRNVCMKQDDGSDDDEDECESFSEADGNDY